MSDENCFFDRMYGASKDVIAAAKKPTIKRRLKRKLQSAFDDAEEKKIDAEQSIENARESFEYYNINNILEQRQLIAQLEELQKQIKAEYLFLFGKEM